MLAVIGAASTLAISALVVPSASAAPKPTVAQVEKNITALQDQAEQATENYNQAKEQLNSINVRLRVSKQKLKAQQTEVAAAKVQVGQLAAAAYRQGQLTTLDVLLSDDPDAILAQAGFLPSLSDRQNGALDRLKLGEAQLTATQSDITAAQKRAQTTNDAMKKNADLVKKKLAQAQAQLDSLQAPQRAELAANQRSFESKGVPDGGSQTYCLSMAAQAPSSGARSALNYACDHLGDDYVWAGDGPSTFDCSGLTMQAWKRGGVSLPHSSAEQATYGTRVSYGSAQPGDLVFFHSPISHVGIYLGDGLMVHAPHSGDVVRVAAVYESPVAVVHF